MGTAKGPGAALGYTLVSLRQFIGKRVFPNCLPAGRRASTVTPVTAQRRADQPQGGSIDVNGNFGFLGAAGGTPGYHNGAVGQDPGATGYNNSHTDCQG